MKKYRIYHEGVNLSVAMKDKTYVLLNNRDKKIKASFVNELIRKHIHKFDRTGDYGIYFYSSKTDETINGILLNYHHGTKSILIFKLSNKYAALGVDFAIFEDELTINEFNLSKRKPKAFIRPLRAGLRKVKD